MSGAGALCTWKLHKIFIEGIYSGSHNAFSNQQGAWAEAFFAFQYKEIWWLSKIEDRDQTMGSHIVNSKSSILSCRALGTTFHWVRPSQNFGNYFCSFGFSNCCFSSSMLRITIMQCPPFPELVNVFSIAVNSAFNGRVGMNSMFSLVQNVPTL